MREKGISRNIGGGGSKRPAGEGPGLGNLNKVAPGDPVPAVPVDPVKGERRRRRVLDDGRHQKELDDKRAKSAMMLWTMTLGIGGLIVIILGLVFWLKPFIERRDRMAAISPDADKNVPLEESLVEEVFGEDSAVDLTKRALAARDEEEISATIDPGTMPVAEVAAFLEDLRQEDGEISRYEWMTRLDTTREEVVGVLVSFKKGEERRNRIALLSKDAGRKWKMDFPAFARLATPSWSELKTGRVNAAVVRVYVADDQYFNGPFTESDGWRCYGIASPDVPELMFGYCKTDSEQAKAINLLLDRRKMARATLGLERVEGAETRQFRIKRVLAQDWLVGDVAADQATE